MPLNGLFKVNQSDRNQFCTKIIDSSAPRADYYFLVILSTLIVALGLLADNVILVIGGMLVTPLLSPILAIALGVVINEGKVIIRSLKIFLISIAFAFVVSLLTGFLSGGHVNLESSELVAAMQPGLLTLLIAVVAGLAASYTWAKPDLNETLPGIAVTVTLIPPLTAIGLAAAGRDWGIFRDVLNVFLLNVLGIIAASIIIISLMDFYKARRKVMEEVKQEEKQLAKEKEKVKKAS
jgi:uncharacterized hydrophobic protein (TIGR00271 family)